MARYIYLLVLAILAGACATSSPTSNPPVELPETRPPDPTRVPGPAASPLQATQLLPLDPAVQIDTLDNGLVYYIRPNDEPQNRAELRLVIDAGSILEDDDQRGLAHFLEHMLFNGTRRFEEHQLIDFLERTGMRFGPDVNAYTSFDETVYMLQIPTDSTAIVETAFDVLEDWAAYATLADEEIDNERGVVVEEWRSRRGAGGRIQDQILPEVLAGSRYKDRLPIGDTLTLKTADYESLRRFYRDWYRPDLIAVVAVGDFDAARIEALIQEHFGPLETPDDPRPRPAFDVPGHDETRYAIATDPEFPVTQVQVLFKQEATPFRTTADYRERLIDRLFNGLLNKRIAEIARRGDAPFLTAGVSKGSFVRSSSFVSVSAQVHEDSITTALDALLTEAARVRQHGFTETELARQQTITLRGYERAFNDRANTRSGTFASEYVQHFLEDEPMPGIAYEYELAGRLIPSITVDEVNARAADLLAEQNRVVIVAMPEKEGLTPPTEAELAAVFDQVQAREIEPYVDDVSDAPLVPAVLEPEGVVERRDIPEVGVTEIRLANGVRVVMKPTDFKEEEVLFRAVSPGGTSTVVDADYLAATTADAIVTKSGLGTFDKTALQKKLAGKVATVIPSISELEESLRGSASPTDLETLFQLIHLHFTAPRADSTALMAFKNEQRSYLLNRDATPYGAFQDSLIAALYGDHPRRQVPSIEQIDNLDAGRALALYRDRFLAANEFTFLFVGNFDPDTLTALAQTYLGSLPRSARPDTWTDVAPDLPDGVVTTMAIKGQEPQSQVVLIFHGPFDYDRLHRHRLRSLEGVLDIMIREELREERAGIYSAGVQSAASARPEPTYQFTVSFGTDPARANEMIAAVFEQIDRVKAGEGLEDYVAKVQEQQRRERETSLEQNGFWLGILDFYYTHPEEDLLDALRYDDLIDALTPEAIRDAARRYLDDTRYVQGVLLPNDADME